MRQGIAVVFAVVVFAWSGAPALADTILATESTWEYTFTDPTGSSSWNTTTGGGWATGPAPFGNNIGGGWDPDFDYNTYWAADGSDGDDLWVRIAVDFTGYDLTTADWFLGVDNGFKLYVNGNLVAAHNAEGYTWDWEYSGSISSSYLNSGVNVIAVALEDHGGLTAFDMKITADPTPVPEPATLLLFGAGAGAIAAAKRRRRRAAA